MVQLMLAYPVLREESKYKAMTLKHIARRRIVRGVNRTLGVMIGALMRGGALHDRGNFEHWARRGFYVTSRSHFYHPLPDIYEIRERAKTPLRDPMEGIDIRENHQLELVESVSSEYRDELEIIARETGTGYT